MKTKQIGLLVGVVVLLGLLWGYSQYEAKANIEKCQFELQDIKVLSVKPELTLSLEFKVYNSSAKEVKVDNISFDVFIPNLIEGRAASGTMGVLKIPNNESKIAITEVKIPIKEIGVMGFITSIAKVLTTKTKKMDVIVSGKMLYKTIFGQTKGKSFSFSRELKI